MASITSTTGLGSGMNITQIIKDLISAESTPINKQLDLKEAALQEKISAVSSFKGVITDFQKALAGVRNTSRFQNLTAKAGDEALFSASTTSIAKAGNYSVTVKQLAQAQKLATPAAQRFETVTDPIGTGKLTFTFGAYDADDNSFTENTAKTAKTLTIDTGNNTLAGVRDAINDADLGVEASLINDGSGYRLVVGPSEIGAANGLKISVDDDDTTDADLGGLSLLAYDPTLADGAPGKNMQQTQASQDAKLIVDGLQISGTSNTISGVIPGVAFNLKSAKPDTPTTLTISQDASGASAAVKAFVDAYNELTETTQTLTAYNAATGEKAPLLGDSTVRSITRQIRNLISSAVPGASSSYPSLSAVGISLQRNGSLALDASKLDAALSKDPRAVASLFGRASNASDSQVILSDFSTASRAGVYALNVTQVATQAQYVGGAAGPMIDGKFTIDASNNRFALKVNSLSTSATLTLSAGAYTGNELATEMQTLINANSTLQSTGVSLRVSYEASASRFTFTSSTYGSSTSFEFTEANATLGITAQRVTGRDIAGSIGGITATGSSQQLTGSGPATGMKVDVLGGGAGARGFVSLSDGVAHRLDSLLRDFLGSNGPLSNRTNTLNQQIGRLDEQRQTLNARMNGLETRYRTQFLAMDQLVAQMTSTSNFLTGQFANKDNKNN